MRKKDKLYEVNKWNRELFSEGKPQSTVLFGRRYWPGGTLGQPDYKPQIDGGVISQDYMSNIGGIQGMDFSSGKPKSTLLSNIGSSLKEGVKSGALNGAVGAASGAIGKAIGNGYSSTAGDVLGAVGSVAGMLPGPFGAAASTIANIGSGVLNSLIGTKVDAAKKAANDAGTATLESQTFNAGDFDSVGDVAAVAAVQDAHKGGLFRQGWEDDMNAKDRMDRALALNDAERRRELNIDNIASDQMRDLMAHYNALGGKLPSGKPSGTVAAIYDGGGFLPSAMTGVFGDTGMGAVDYGFLSDYLTEKKRQNDLKSKMSGGNVFVGKPQSTLFALGGDVQVGGGDFTTGLTHIDEGGSHESNEYGGVQMGVDGEGIPNLVEEGEVVYDDYVYSNRITCDSNTKKLFHIGNKREITYADLAKKLEKEIKERPNDSISKAGFDAQMHQLADEQERQKQEMEAERAREAFEALSDEEKVAVMQEMAAREQEAMQANMPATQPSPEEAAMMQQEMMAQQGGQPIADAMGTTAGQGVPMEGMQGGAPVMAEGGMVNRFDTGGKKNSGSWKKDVKDPWGTYTRPGLEGFLDRVEAALKEAKTDEEKQAIRERAMEDFNGIQQSYHNIYPGRSDGQYDKNTAVENHQRIFDARGGNKGFYETDDNGNIRNLIAESIDLPAGANTEDNPATNWVDGYWGPRTSIRNFGSTEYGGADYYKDIADRFNKIGLNYTPNDDWTYGNDNQLYQLSMMPTAVAEPTVTRADIDEPIYTGEGNGDLPANAGGTAAGGAGSVNTGNGAAGSGNGTGSGDTGAGDTGKGIKPRLYKETSLGLWGPAINLGLMGLGVGKPDTSGIDVAMRTINGAPVFARYQPIGDYFRHKPLDVLAERNRANADALAAQRNLVNISGGNRGAAMAGVLANTYKSQVANGELFSKNIESENNQGRQDAVFNRETNIFDAQAYNQNQQFNTDIANRNRQASAQMQLQAAGLKDDANRWWASNIYGNINGIFDRINQWEKYKRDHNAVADMYANGLAGVVTEDTPVARRYVKPASKGGQLNKRKNRRGLTY